MLIFLQPVDWSLVVKNWGFAGVVGVVCLLLLVGAAKFLRAYLTKKDEETAKLVTDTLVDARKERDRMASQLDRRDELITEQAQRFTESLRHRDAEFKQVADAIERVGRRR